MTAGGFFCRSRGCCFGRFEVPDAVSQRACLSAKIPLFYKLSACYIVCVSNNAMVERSVKFAKRRLL